MPAHGARSTCRGRAGARGSLRRVRSAARRSRLAIRSVGHAARRCSAAHVHKSRLYASEASPPNRMIRHEPSLGPTWSSGGAKAIEKARRAPACAPELSRDRSPRVRRCHARVPARTPTAMACPGDRHPQLAMRTDARGKRRGKL